MKNTSNDLAQNEKRAGTTCAIHACGVRYTIMLNDAILALLGKSKASMTRVHGQPCRVVWWKPSRMIWLKMSDALQLPLS